MDRPRLMRLQHAAWLPVSALICATTLCFWHVLLQPTTAWVGDACSIDFQGTLQQLWLLRFHHYDLGELSHTVYLNYPTPVSLFSELGFVLDILLLASTQALFGSVLGYNLGAWVIFVGLALAIYHCARRFGLAPWFAALAALIAISAEPITLEIASGRLYQLVALATASACLAEWPLLASANRLAAIRMGVWLTLTILAHPFTGQLMALFLLVTSLVTLVRADGGARVILTRQFLWAGGATLLLATGPIVFQLAHMPSGEESQGMLSGYHEYYQRVLHLAELKGMAPWQLVGHGHLRIIVLALAAAGLFVRRYRPATFIFAGLFVGALLVVWGPYQHVIIPFLDGQELAFDIPLPYLALRATLPYLWRLLWLKRVLPFANLAMGMLAAMALSQLYLALRSRPFRAHLVVAVATALCLVQPLANRSLPLPRSLVIEELEEGPEAAALLARVKSSPEVGVVFSIARVLHLQERFEKPLSAPKWASFVSCDNRTLDDCGRLFESFVEMPDDLPAREKLRRGLCHLEQTGTTHLLFFPLRFIRHAGFRSDPAREATVAAEQDEIRGTLHELARLADEGGGVELYQLLPCNSSPDTGLPGLSER